MESNPGLGGVVDDMTLKSTPAVDIVDLTHEENEVAAKEGLLHSLEHHDLGADISPSDLEGASVDDTDDNENEVWETESLYEDALEGLGDDQLLVDHHVDSCTLDEAVAFRKRLRLIGDEAFVAETIEARVITAKKLCTAFGIRPPQFLEGAPDHAYYPLLSLGISRELSKREKLPEYNTIDDAVELLQKSKNIIVLTGAGISTSLGIPDFRSKDTGLYSKLEYLGLSDPQEVFDIDLFREDPSIFYSIAKDILPETNKFSPTHAFIRLLETKGKLLTNFTQNIDNLEGHAGISPEKLIQCHGSFATASCVKCRHQVPGTEIYPELKAGQVARCLRCLQQMREDGGTGLKRKRSLSRSSSRDPCKHRRWSNQSSDDDEGDYDIPEAGVMKPDITFFGEDLPETFHRRLVNHDRALVDLVVVIGTSLKVAPVSEVIGFLPPETPQIYISRTPVSHVNFDVDMLGDCDIVVAELCRRAGWDLRHEMIPAAQRIAVEPIPGYASRWLFRVEQPAAEADAQEREG